MPHQALGNLVLGLWKARVWGGHLWGWWLRWEAQSPLGWWPQGETFRVGSTQDVSLGTAVRSGVLSSPNSCPSACQHSLSLLSGRALGGAPCVWFALLQGCKWLLWGAWCQVWGKCWHILKVWEPSLKLEGTMELRDWVLFRNIWYGKGWKWVNDAAAAIGFQKPCKDFVAGGSSEPPPVCWGPSVPAALFPPVWFMRQCLVGPPVSLSTQMSWVPASGLDLLGGGDVSQQCWSIAALLTEQLMDVNITLAFYLQLVLDLCLELSFFSMHADLFWTINLTASEQ